MRFVHMSLLAVSNTWNGRIHEPNIDDSIVLIITMLISSRVPIGRPLPGVVKWMSWYFVIQVQPRILCRLFLGQVEAHPRILLTLFFCSGSDDDKHHATLR